MSIIAFLNYSCNIQVIKSLNQHNHGENPVSVKLSEASSQIKSAAAQSMKRPVQVRIFFHSSIDSFCKKQLKVSNLHKKHTTYS